MGWLKDIVEENRQVIARWPAWKQALRHKGAEMNWRVYITGKVSKEEECIAHCAFGDDAELIYGEYVKAGYSTRVTHKGLFSSEEENYLAHVNTEGE